MLLVAGQVLDIEETGLDDGSMDGYDRAVRYFDRENA